MCPIIFDKGYVVCTATHPSQPNWSGRARGRKLHLVSRDKRLGDRKLTLCGMMKDEVMTRERVEYTVYDDPCRECANCIKEAQKYAMQEPQNP